MGYEGRREAAFAVFGAGGAAGGAAYAPLFPEAERQKGRPVAQAASLVGIFGRSGLLNAPRDLLDHALLNLPEHIVADAQGALKCAALPTEASEAQE